MVGDVMQAPLTRADPVGVHNPLTVAPTPAGWARPYLNEWRARRDPNALQ